MRLVQRVIGAELVSASGTALTQFAVPVAIINETHSAATAGVVASLLTFGTVTGVVAAPRVIASLGCRLSMLLADSSAVAVATVLCVVSLLQGINVTALALGFFLLGLARNCFASAQQIVLGQIATGDELASAYGQVMAASRTANIAGPILSGAAVAGPGLWPLFAIDAISFGLSAALVLSVTRRIDASIKAEQPQGPRAAVRTIMRSGLLRWWTTAAGITEVAWQVFFLSLPVVAVAIWHSPVAAGVLFAGFSAGSVLGSLAAGRAAREVGRVRLASVTRAAIPAIYVAVALFYRDYAVFLSLVCVSGVVNGLATPGIAAIVREAIPRSELPGVLSLRYSLNLTGGVAGRAGGGFLLDLVTVGAALGASAALQALGWWAFRLGEREYRNADATPG